MQTLSVKLPDPIRARLALEARRRRVTRSEIVREVLAEALEKMAAEPSALDLAGDLVGCCRSGLPDLATNPKYLEEAIMADHERSTKRNR